MFQVEIDLVVDLNVINPFDFFVESYADEYPFEYEPTLKEDLKPYLKVPEPGPQLKKYLDGIDRSPLRMVDFLVYLNHSLHKKIQYVIRMEPNIQSPEQTLSLKSGSCRDTSWLLVYILRNLGLAARFVSGYLIQLSSDVKSIDGPSGPSMDFTDLHAWAEVYVPGAGWIGLDPTSGLFAGEGHIPLACSPEPKSAAPITGSLEECEVDFSHEMKVTRIFEAPRSTRPYPEEVWHEILDIGYQVDEDLDLNDVRLTMGGEPTFISIDDMEGDEWNTAAMGPTKRKLSDNLLKRLKDKWAPGGLLHYGSGKWYPGESLPRWALSCYWRKDGKPIWNDDTLIADESIDYGYGVKEAKLFIETLANNLGVEKKFIKPTYEDIIYYIWKEQRLPVNVNPLESNLKDPEERERLARVFEKGLGEPSGFILPIQYGSWISGEWPFRGKHMFLIPGDSPIGLRLPLDSLPWIPESKMPQIHSMDPMVKREQLPDFDEKQISVDEIKQKQESKGVQHQYLSDDEEPDTLDPEKIVRTALCVQPRNGKLYVFMPPLADVDHYLELVAILERTAKQLNLKVIIEGYNPPHDSRINVLKITPDPGVIEVNIQPANNWDELVKITTELYSEARENRLGTEKFLVDGRHTGTGGGNHIVIGGATPSDSPFIRRPDLLRSIVAYVNNHPALSYLFSGLFIGPTSQRPRIDEARHDSLYELELAFLELDRQLQDSQYCPPWLVDRIFRHILVDVTGNTHRTEFCIDKLYSPDSSSGRLGLVEFRAFEMPPHARMSLAQQLLLRVLLAWFWKEPYRQSLVRWGTRLNDQFMLPHFIEKDFKDVLNDLNKNEYALKMHHFHPHFEFRFPEFGTIVYQNIAVELRQAIEPWHVLGEEVTGTGTARYVDSSLERLQVKVKGLTDSRHIITCNGRRTPLHPTGDEGFYVAGVRYRAWQPPSCLHPTIPVHTPLVFDILDLWTQRSVGGCTYYVSHPGGRHHEDFPVNENAAQGRRNARFVPMGYTPGKIDTIPPEENNHRFPFTLDLRVPKDMYYRAESHTQ
ncbi:MAG: transglutaminase [Candidatus Magnetoglobus multicellularis str. Araruama]|uniref:Transglutaminase n=1 Tax=Candidatus Magnetoglobus multicellularis str. Araruama TaxID=890399 RepID=A0A1V1PFC7_9BACT|nr:MAG: transglutaminase [Candidatus Magnetoglobus multicellularis str. Araruama]